MIESIYVENFMTLKGEHEIPFPEGNVLNIVGLNNRGKSAIVIALSILMYDSFQKEQTGYISYGEKYFKVGLVFDDGVSIYKTKFSSGNSLWEMYKDDELVFSNKQGKHLISVTGVPEVIQKYLGVLVDEETGERLNIRTGRGKLLLVGTTGSENYKILNTILHSDVLSAATKAANSDRNSVGAKLTECSQKYLILDEENKSFEVMNEEQIALVERAVQELELYRDAWNAINGMDSKLEESLAISVGELVESIDIGGIELLSRIESGLEELYGIELGSEIEPINTERATEVNRLYTLVESYSEVFEGVELDSIDTSIVSDLNKLGKSFESYTQADEELRAMESQNKDYHEKYAKLVAKYEQETGDKFAICQKCGSPVIFCGDV